MKILEAYNQNSVIKVGLISDSHLAIHRRNNVFFPHMQKTIKLFLENCRQREVDFIIHTGDLFDTKHIISTEGLILSNDLIEEITKEFLLVAIPGNHDFAYTEEDEYNLVSNYKNHKNVIVVEKYSKAVFEKAKTAFHFLPYEKFPAEHIKKIKPEGGLKNILFCHVGISGFKMHENASQFANQISAQLSIPELNKFDKVFTGHYHGYQIGSNIVYVSAPLQSRHGDEKSKHGFVFYNTAKKSHEFIENVHTPKFISYQLTKKNVEEMLQLRDHYIRIFVKKKVRVELLTALKKKLLKKNYDVMIDFDMMENFKLAVIEGWKDFVMKDPDNLIINYLDLLEKEGELPYPKMELLKLLGVNIK